MATMWTSEIETAHITETAHEPLSVFERRFDMLETLKDGERHNVREFRERYNIEKGAVMTDMECLSKVAPIQTFAGRYGGYEYDGMPELLVDTAVFRRFVWEMKDRRMFFSEGVMEEWKRLERRLMAFDCRDLRNR